MEYTLIKSKRRTISIMIDKDANIIVKAPVAVSQKYIDEYVASKKSWIEKNVKRMSENAILRQPKEYTGGEVFMIFGKEYTMCISSVDDEIKIVEDRIFFPSAFLDDPKQHMVDWYLDIAKKYIIKRAEQIAQQTNLNPNKIKITKADKRWGSCSSKKNINFSYKLVMANENAIDYVIIHELAHLLHMNHSRQFWATVGSLMPDYKQHKKYLKDIEAKFVL